MVTVKNSKPVKTFEEIKKTLIAKNETAPVISADEKYHRIEEGELVKHYNMKSSYLTDMIHLEEFK